MKAHPYRHHSLSRKRPLRRPSSLPRNRVPKTQAHDESVSVPVVWKNLLSGQTHSGDRVHVGGSSEQKGSRVQGDAYICAGDSVEEGTSSQGIKIREPFRAWVKQQRNARGWSRNYLAKRLVEIGFEITENQLWRIEAGRTSTIDIEFYMAVQVAFGESFQRLMTEQEGIKWLRSLLTSDPLGRVGELPDEAINLMRALLVLRSSD